MQQTSVGNTDQIGHANTLTDPPWGMVTPLGQMLKSWTIELAMKLLSPHRLMDQAWLEFANFSSNLFNSLPQFVTSIEAVLRFRLGAWHQSGSMCECVMNPLQLSAVWEWPRFMAAAPERLSLVALTESELNANAWIRSLRGAHEVKADCWPHKWWTWIHFQSCSQWGEANVGLVSWNVEIELWWASKFECLRRWVTSRHFTLYFETGSLFAESTEFSFYLEW